MPSQATGQSVANRLEPRFGASRQRAKPVTQPVDAQETESPFAPGTDGGPCHHRLPMTAYFALKFLHVLGAAVLLGTCAGIAFFMVMAHRTKDAGTVAGVARTVVVADFLFTATAVVAQPITGVLLAWHLGYPLLEGWIVLSISLYLFTGAFWLPVVWMQMRMRDLPWQAHALANHCPPPTIASSVCGSPSAFPPSRRCWRSCG